MKILKQLVSCDDIKLNDEVVVHVGNVIPFDGEVIDGEAMFWRIL